jgi:hypothetical protein
VDVRIRPVLDEAGNEMHAEASSSATQEEKIVPERPQQHSQQ